MAAGDKGSEYQRYAEACLATAKMLPSREQRILQREMAAEWFKLADAVESEFVEKANGHEIRLAARQ